MMTRFFFFLTIVLAGIASYVIVVSTTSSDQPPAIVLSPGITTSTPVNPYDSIKTDLSDYIWPTTARKVTSTFAEFRRTHFHGGIDIGTGSMTGYPVFASRDGYVARIRVSPNGYGRMLYLRHRDGYYTTYAHLERFAPALNKRAQSEQQRLERYPVDIECSLNEFPIRKGDLIAYSGESGVGTPHLHFEIRDENLNFINPFLCEKLRAPDNISPTVKKIALRPLGQHSLINGSWEPRVYDVHPSGEGFYRLPEPIQITGDVGFAIDVRDRSNGSSFKHGAYSHQLFVDDELLYYVRLDRAPSDEAYQIGLYYDLDLLDAGQGRFEKLYMDTPNDLPMYFPRGDTSGILSSRAFTQGVHTFRIISGDVRNNRAEVIGTLILNHPPRFEIERSDEALKLHFADVSSVHRVLLFSKRHSSTSWTQSAFTPDKDAAGNTITIPLVPAKYDMIKVIGENQWGTTSHPHIYFLNKPKGPAGSLTLGHTIDNDLVRLMLETNRGFSSPPSVVVYEGNVRRLIPLVALDVDRYAGTFRPLESYKGTRRIFAEGEINGQTIEAQDEFDIYPIVAGRSDTIILDEGKLSIFYDSTSVFKTFFMQVHKEIYAGEVTYTLSPDRTVLKGRLIVRVSVDPTRKQLGLYFGNRGRGQLIATSASNTRGTITGIISQTLGELSVLGDNTPPYISRLTISPTSTRRPMISFRFGDAVSGVEYNELKMYIDGDVVIPEIDGEHRRAFYQAPDPLVRGSHRITIRLKDKLGNTSEVERRFVVR